ncbi:hypothetical protein ACROYT_G024526 [Oculina patagonica]
MGNHHPSPGKMFPTLGSTILKFLRKTVPFSRHQGAVMFAQDFKFILDVMGIKTEAALQDYCIMEDYINPAKAVESDDYWIPAKRPKVMAALRRAFPQAEWDVLTTTIDFQIADEDKQHPAKRLAKLSNHYLGEEPIIQCTHHFLRILKQDPGMSIQQWHTLVRLEYYKCNFPSAVDDRLQRDIFVIGLNDTFKQFRSDLISRENLASLTFEQVINKALDFEAGLKLTTNMQDNPFQTFHPEAMSMLNLPQVPLPHHIRPIPLHSFLTSSDPTH